MVRREKHMALAQYALEGVIPRLAGRCFKTATVWLHFNALNTQGNFQTVTVSLTNLTPVVGIGIKTMIDVNGRDGRTGNLYSSGMQCIKQCHTIGAAGKRHPPV